VISCLQLLPLSDIIDSINEQGGALRPHFEAVVAAVELPVAHGKLKNRIKTSLGNPLCRGVDELCTELLNARGCLMVSSLDRVERLRGILSQNTELLLRETIGLKKLNAGLGKENDRLDLLVIFVSREIETQACQVSVAERECADALQRTPSAIRRSGGHGNEL
jgi:hypothetical protein